MKFTKHAVVIALASLYCVNNAMDDSMIDDSRPKTEIALIALVQSSQKAPTVRSLKDSTGDFTLEQTPSKRFERAQERSALSPVENCQVPMNQDDVWKKHIYGDSNKSLSMDSNKQSQVVQSDAPSHVEANYRHSKELFFE